MNKLFLKSLVVTLLLVVPSISFALKAHDETNGYAITCASCHAPGTTIGNRDATYDQNVCLRCHKPGDLNSTKNFSQDDFANPYNTTVKVQAAPKMNSHKWFGTDVVPGAGAKAPTLDPRAKGLLWTGYKDYLSCGRCHSVHGTSGNVEALTTPYLRADNLASDQMCRNCHAPRDVVSHTLGSHPVNVSYSSAYRNHSSSYLKTPIVNVANPTAQIKLINGKVVCSTCHAVHNADSDSATFDSYTSVQTPNTKGHLLRLSPFGTAANDTNVCTNCHTKKTAHNTTVASGKGIQCNDCHSAHVEYDKNAPASTPNVYLVRRYLQYSTAGRPSGKIVFDDAINKKYYTAGGGGVCQSCHNVTATHFEGGVVNGTLLIARTNCAACHTHNDTTGSFRPGSGSCDTCHGYPPIDNTTEGPTGRATGYTGDETTSAHISHSGGTANYSYSCAQCHNGSVGTGATHNDGTSSFKNLFVTKEAVVAGGVIAGANPAYSGTQCSNVYCHSDGTSTTTLGSPKTVTWANGLNLNPTCSSCHASVPTTGAHTYHATTIAATKGYGCVTCHSTTVSNNTTVTVSGGKHVNAVKDVNFSDTGLGAGLATKVTGTNCSAVYCHSNGKGNFGSVPVWGTPTSGRCGTCHATGTTTGLGVIATTAHPLHITAIGGGNASCTSCHTYTAEISAGHINGTVDVTTGCATTSCHGNLAPATYSWAAPSTATTCTKCHGTKTVTVTVANREVLAPKLPLGSDTGNVSADTKTGAHQAHMLYSNGLTGFGTKDDRCQNCHGTLPTTGKHANLSSTPVFQGLAEAGGMTSATFSGGSCSATYCHNPAASSVLTSTADGTGVAPSWTDSGYIANAPLKTQTNCGKCHKSPGDAGFPTDKYDHGTMPIANNCADCHGHNGDTAGIVGQQHMDGILYGSSSCKTCHGYPPVTSMTGLGVDNNFKDAALATQGGGGHHTSHLLKTVIESDQFAPCLPCHPSGYHNQNNGVVLAANVNVFGTSDTGFRLDASRTKRYSKPANTCSNVSCHFQPTPAW